MDSTVKIVNEHFFDTTQTTEFSWILQGDGCDLGSGILDLPIMAPQSSYDIEFKSSPWYSLWKSCSATEVFLTITAKLKHSTRWAEDGHVLASTQLCLLAKSESSPHVINLAKSKILLSEFVGDILTVSKQNIWQIKLNTCTGTIESWKVEGCLLTNQGILPCFWRAPTDNDKGGGPDSYASKWKAAGLDNVSFHTGNCSIKELSDHSVQITAVYFGVSRDQEILLGSGGFNEHENSSYILFRVDVFYWISETGDLIIEYNINPKNDLPPLPRVGVVFHVDQALDHVTWYGKGPFECYPDRKEAAHVGIYESTVEDMHVPYIAPGECSGRADVRWVAFRNRDGVGLFASIYGTSPPMQMSASYYSTEELDKKTHNQDLVKGDDIEVHLDHKHMGLGGDDSWSPSVHDQYLVPPISYSFSVRLCAVLPSTSCQEIYRSQLPQ